MNKQTQQLLLLGALAAGAYFIFSESGFASGSGALPRARYQTRTGLPASGPTVDPWTGLAVDAAGTIFDDIHNSLFGGSGQTSQQIYDYNSDPLQYE